MTWTVLHPNNINSLYSFYPRDIKNCSNRINKTLNIANKPKTSQSQKSFVLGMRQNMSFQVGRLSKSLHAKVKGAGKGSIPRMYPDMCTKVEIQRESLATTIK